jgi:hypothetical protein
MGIFNKLFKKPAPVIEPKIILAMALLPDSSSYNFESFISELRKSFDIKDLNGDSTSCTFNIDGEQFGVMNMDFPIPSDDIAGTAKYAYNWETALEDLKDHKSHIIVAALPLQGSQDQIKRFSILTKIMCLLLKNTQAIGVYLGEQSLLIPKMDYLTEASLLSDDFLPLNIWIYIGLRTIDEKTNAYTYGLEAFGKREIEILNSYKKIADLRELLFNLSHYVLLSDVTFQDGQTAGLTEDQKLKITYSKGEFVTGNSFKINY